MSQIFRGERIDGHFVPIFRLARELPVIYGSFQIHATRFAIDMKKKNGTNGNNGTNGACDCMGPFVPLFPFVPFFFF